MKQKIYFNTNGIHTKPLTGNKKGLLFVSKTPNAQPFTFISTSAGTQTWIAPETCNVSIECWGGGGGGAASINLNRSGGGGGGGGYSKKNSYAVTKGTSYTIVIGGGGGGGASGSSYTGNVMLGNAGGDTYFVNTSIVHARGGKGAGTYRSSPIEYITANAGMGGQLGTGDVKYVGGNGTGSNNHLSNFGGHGGSSAGTGADGYTQSGGEAVQLYPTDKTPSGGGHGGNGGSSEYYQAGSSGGVGAGGGGSYKSANGAPTRNGGNGRAGQIIIKSINL